MSVVTSATETRAANGKPLKQQLRRAQRMRRLWALGLVAPALLFIGFTFVWPIAVMLFRSVENSMVAETLPLTVAALQEWPADSAEPPGEPAFAALVQDMSAAVAAKTHTRLGSRLNYEQTGMASLFRKSGRAIKRLDPAADAPFREKLIGIDSRWGEAQTWATIKLHSPRLTDGYFIAAVDLRRTPAGIERQPESKRILLTLFWRTFYMSIAITLCCLLLGYPVAWLLASVPLRTANLLLILVLLPFWTSLLMRTSAWKVLLQQQGVINDALVWLGLVADDARLVMINNQFGTVVAMTHILLPFMILPLYAVMQGVQPGFLRAARSLGATGWTAFWRVYFPQTRPGLGAGATLTFILAIGYYITPEIVGGTTGVFISNRIAYHISSSLNWGLAAALGAILLALVLWLWLRSKAIDLGKMRLG